MLKDVKETALKSQCHAKELPVSPNFINRQILYFCLGVLSCSKLEQEITQAVRQ